MWYDMRKPALKHVDRECLENPECHMLYNVTTMASTWHTVATGDVRLLRRQMDAVAGLPGE